MKTFRPLSVFRRLVLHRVEVRHEVSGQPIPGLSAELLTGPAEWSVGVVNGDVVVSGPAGSEADGPARITLLIASPAIELFLDTTGDAMTVTLSGTHQIHHIAPADQDIDVAVLDGDGAPVAGATVLIQSSVDPAVTVPTTETVPGRYRTDLQRFTDRFNRFTVVVDGDELADGGLMSWQTSTSVTVISIT